MRRLLDIFSFDETWERLRVDVKEGDNEVTLWVEKDLWLTVVEDEGDWNEGEDDVFGWGRRKRKVAEVEDWELTKEEFWEVSWFFCSVFRLLWFEFSLFPSLSILWLFWVTLAMSRLWEKFGNTAVFAAICLRCSISSGLGILIFFFFGSWMWTSLECLVDSESVSSNFLFSGDSCIVMFTKKKLLRWGHWTIFSHSKSFNCFQNLILLKYLFITITTTTSSVWKCLFDLWFDRSPEHPFLLSFQTPTAPLCFQAIKISENIVHPLLHMFVKSFWEIFLLNE